MHAAQALAVRRGALAAAGLLAGVAAHAAAAGRLDLLPAAPALWGALVSVATLAGPRGGWRPRGTAATVALLLAAQAATHVVATAAPWAVGLGGHGHAAPLLAPAGLAAHAVATVVLGVLLVRGGRILDAAVHALRVARRAVRRRGAGGARWTGVPPTAAGVRGRVAVPRAGARGPPGAAVATHP
jgi:hypothetical protein